MPARHLHAEETAAAQVQPAFEFVNLVDSGPAHIERHDDYGKRGQDHD